MSINSAMLAGITGLTANSSALAVISDNIANSNTVGFKRNQADFETLVTGQSLTDDYVAGGVLEKTQQLITQQGLNTQTSSATDLAVDGQGFFVVTGNSTPTATDTREFTRAGSFTPDKDGYLRNAAGLYLQGWPADATGAITTDPTDVTKLSSINVEGLTNIANVGIDDKGIVTAVLDDGTTKTLGQVAVATFPDANSLHAVSGNAYQTSGTSGAFTLNAPGTGSAGLLSPSTLEASTVDLSTEFAGLIITQRAYSASSKIITTADSMLQDLLSVIR